MTRIDRGSVRHDKLEYRLTLRIRLGNLNSLNLHILDIPLQRLQIRLFNSIKLLLFLYLSLIDFRWIFAGDSEDETSFSILFKLGFL